MSEKFQNKYRIPSARWQHWDYGSQGAYFITICTKNREHFFGSVKDGEMILNELGLIVKNEWIKTIEKRPDMNLELGEFVVMPNHFHAVILIGHNEYNSKNNHDEIKDGFDTIKINETEKYRTVSDDETYNCDDMVKRGWTVTRGETDNCDDINNCDDMVKRGGTVTRGETDNCDDMVTRGWTVTRRDAMHCVSTINVPSIPTTINVPSIPTTINVPSIPTTIPTTINVPSIPTTIPTTTPTTIPSIPTASIPTTIPSTPTTIPSALSTPIIPITPNPTTSQKNQFGVQSKNLASIVRGFKSSVTTNAKIIGNKHFAWQPRFHDHVIRDAHSFERIQQYILNNPKKWIDDTFYN